MKKWESCQPWQIILSTPRASDMKAGGHGDTGRMGTVRHQLQVAMLGAPTANSAPRGSVLRKMKDRMTNSEDDFDRTPTISEAIYFQQQESLPVTDRWAYARLIASTLRDGGLTGPSMTLPLTYNWMMGFPPGWLTRALRSAVLAGHLQQVSSSKRSATPSSRKSPKP